MVSLKTDHHPELSLSPADRDHWPQRATDLCRAVEGLIHESRIIAHDERVRPQRLGAVRTGFVQAHHSRQQALAVVDDEHWVVLLHQSLSESAILSGSRLSGMSVGNGRTDGKRVCQFECPNGVKSLMRRSHPGTPETGKYTASLFFCP